MPGSSPYLFLELGLMLFVIAFGWRHWRVSDLASRPFLRAAGILVITWFIVDQTAVHLGLWDFPPGGTWRIRFLGLPLEEYFLFILHPIICLALIRQAKAGA